MVPRTGVRVTNADPDRVEPDLFVEDHFAMVPEWLLDADVSDCAVRLYAVLLRFGQSSGARMPGRATLARRLHKKSVDTVDRALRELVALGAVAVEARFDGPVRLTNRYRVRTSRPSQLAVVGGRTDAATPIDAAGSGRADAAGVAAKVRHNPESLTQSETPPPPTPSAGPAAAVLCGIADWDSFVARVRSLRVGLGQPVGRWSGPCLDAALQLAVKTRGWPAMSAASALLAVAAASESRAPMRVAEAGPWWDAAAPIALADPAQAGRLASMEADLAESDGRRLVLQESARRELAAEGQPLTRTTVTRRAWDLLQKSDTEAVS